MHWKVSSAPLHCQGSPSKAFSKFCCLDPCPRLCLCACSAVSSSFATPWAIAHLAPLSVGFSQTRILECVAISSSKGSPRPRDQSCASCLAGRFFTTEPLALSPKSDLLVDVVALLSHVRPFETPWTAAHQAPLSFTSPGVCSHSHLYHSGACLHIKLDWLDSKWEHSTFWRYNHVK